MAARGEGSPERPCTGRALPAAIRRLDALRGRKGQHCRPHGQRKPAAWQDCAVGLSTFPHPRASTAIQWLACGSAKLFTDPYTGHYVGWPRAGVIGASSHACPGPLRARGAYDQGTRQDPSHQGHSQAGPRPSRQRHARWQPYPRVGPDRLPGRGDWGPGHGGELLTGPSKPRTGTGCAGLALAPPPVGNCAASGRRGGLVGALAQQTLCGRVPAVLR